MNTSPVLLDDGAMKRFIMQGYIVLKPDFPNGFNDMIYGKTAKVIEEGGNPANNVLPAIPELQAVFDHPVVHGAMSSILGPDYYLHLHRHVHDNPPGSKGQKMHKDSLLNSRFAVDGNRRHHHTRWTMAFYYPQDTPVELGPTGIVPESQYLNVDAPEGVDELPLTGEAGTVVIVHYDLLHRGMPNRTDKTRYMHKFLFTRMSEPTAPSWRHTDPTWAPTGHPQDAIWQYMWNWHRGATPGESVTNGSLKDLETRLRDDAEVIGLTAAYALGRHGKQAVDPLLTALRDDTAALPRNAAYGFNNIGAEAVPALIDASHDEQATVRARAIDVLGDMGPCAEAATSALIESLSDPSDDVRGLAAEAFGTIGPASSAAVSPLANVLRTAPTWQIRRNAALSLSRMGPHAHEAVPALAEALHDESHYVRGYAVQALSRIDAPKAATAVMKYLQTMRWDQGQS